MTDKPSDPEPDDRNGPLFQELCEFDDLVAELRGAIEAGHPFPAIEGTVKDIHTHMLGIVLKVGVLTDQGEWPPKKGSGI